jgi:hypothetical protein
VHLFWGAFEDSPTTTRKEGVADERELGAEICDVAGGVARDVDDLELEAKFRERNEVTATDRVIDAADVLACGTEDRHPPDSKKVVHATDVVAVVMGQEDGAKLELPFFEDLKHRRGLTRIDDNRHR